MAAPAADTALRRVHRPRPWVLDPAAHLVDGGASTGSGPTSEPAARAHPAAALPPGPPVVRPPATSASPSACGPPRNGGSGSIKVAGISRRLRQAAEALGPTYIKLGQILSLGRGHLPRGARRRVQEVPRPGAARAVGRDRAGRRGGAGPAARHRVRLLRADAARRRVHRPGAPGDPARRHRRRGQGAATVGGRPCTRTCG